MSEMDSTEPKNPPESSKESKNDGSDLEDEFDLQLEELGSKNDGLEDDASKVTITKLDLKNLVADAVAQAVGNLQSLAGLTNLLTSLNNRNDSARTFSFPKYEKEDKLIGTKNFVTWRHRFELDLRTNRLSGC